MRVEEGETGQTNTRNRYIYVNEKHLMANGVFVDNPFYKQYKVTRVVGYLMGHPEQSKRMIKKLMRQSGYNQYTGQVLDDIYGYAMDFHSVKQDKDFRPNYFNDSGYRIETYIENALLQAVRSYNKKKLLNKKTKETNVDDDPETKNTISSKSFVAEELESSRTELGYFQECFEYMMALVEGTKPKNKKITPELVYDVFLSGFDKVNIRRQLTQREGYYELDETFYEGINKKHKMTERQVTAWMKRIKKSEDYEPFVEMTKELIVPIREGNFMREDIVGFDFEEEGT